jgi:hypothetical protein
MCALAWASSEWGVFAEGIARGARAGRSSRAVDEISGASRANVGSPPGSVTSRAAMSGATDSIKTINRAHQHAVN